jgi:hypothetical protein
MPTLAEILKSPKRTHFIRKLGFKRHYSGTDEDILAFAVDETLEAEVRVLDYASTKVRDFGSSYRLDRQNRKQSSEPEWSLERIVPKLAKRDRHGYHSETSSHSIVLIAHAPTRSDIHALVGRTRDNGFLMSYSVSLVTREWEDRYGRDFHSAMYLWTGYSPA